MEELERLIEAIDSEDLVAVTSLVQRHPAIVYQIFGEEQPLHCAIRGGNEEIVQQLLIMGAKINAPGNNAESPLHYAIRLRSLGMVQLLLTHSPDLTQCGVSGISPLLLAARSGESEIADELIRLGAPLDFHSAIALGRSEKAKNIFLLNPDLINTLRYKNDLLPDAIYSNSPEAVAFLLSIPEIDVHASGLSGDMPLTAAVSFSDANPMIVNLLLAHGADPNRPSRSGVTALDRAKNNGVLHLLKNSNRSQGGHE